MWAMYYLLLLFHVPGSMSKEYTKSIKHLAMNGVPVFTMGGLQSNRINRHIIRCYCLKKLLLKHIGLGLNIIFLPAYCCFDVSAMPV